MWGGEVGKVFMRKPRLSDHQSLQAFCSSTKKHKKMWIPTTEPNDDSTTFSIRFLSPVQVEEEGLKVDWTKSKAKTSFDISRWFADLLISDQWTLALLTGFWLSVQCLLVRGGENAKSHWLHFWFVSRNDRSRKYEGKRRKSWIELQGIWWEMGWKSIIWTSLCHDSDLAKPKTKCIVGGVSGGHFLIFSIHLGVCEARGFI